MSTNVNHIEFIQAPLSNIIDELIIRCSFLKGTIEEFPIKEYLLQSVFIKMCGAQEQKLKCICWELATNNYELRHDYLIESRSYGECSRYDSKRKVYELIYNECMAMGEKSSLDSELYQVCYSETEITNIRNNWKKKQQNKIKRAINKKLKELTSEGKVLTEAEKRSVHEDVSKRFLSEGEYKKVVQKQLTEYILNSADSVINRLVESDNITHGYEHEFDEFSKEGKKAFKGKSFVPWDKDFFKGELTTLYKISLYNHRNRCAHNLDSARKNLPTFNELNDNNNKHCNYYFRFYMLLIIDEVFTKLFSYYQKLRTYCV